MSRQLDRSRTIRHAISVCAVLVSLVGMLLYLASHPHRTILNQLEFLVPLTVSMIGLLLIPFTASRVQYYCVQAGTLLFFAVASVIAGEYPGVQIILLIAYLGELVLLEPYPANIAATLGVSLVVMVGTAIRLIAKGLSAELIVRFELMTILPAITIAVFGSLMTKYRDVVVRLANDRERMRNSIVELTRANSAYQDYALVVQEHATEQERQRITRDIHDIVGYTLTNNLMLMEAAMDLMQENALALPSIIETARENTQEGLNQVRAAMYELRKQQNSYPIGLNAVVRLGRIFEQATGTTVSYDLSNMPLTISDQIDSAIYHLVQEALVNSFRHGAATEVSVSFWYRRGSVQVRIWDNGSGADSIVEGIGLQGMRERIQSIGGSLEAQSTADGFAVTAVIDWNGDTE